VTKRSIGIRSVETNDSVGGMATYYDVLSIDPKCQVKAVVVRLQPDDGYDLKITFQDGTDDWVTSIPAGQWVAARMTLWGKLEKYRCPHFEIAEPRRP
jgi:hypothetical protein